MTERVLLLASHAVAEYDDVRMFTDMGYDVFAPGGYEVPGTEGEGIRPTLPDAPAHPDLVARLNEVRSLYGDPGDLIDVGKARLHDDIIDWADVIICHHFPDRWIAGQWDRIKHKRVIWRTCGQSNVGLEQFMSRTGLEIVRYSPKEQGHYTRKGFFAGQDALIRFGKYPADYGPWIGDGEWVVNVTQNMAQRGSSCGVDFWRAATKNLPARPAGAGSKILPGGVGLLTYPEMLDYLTHARAYLYTGTTPASYTLGLIEAMLSGVPVVSIGTWSWGAAWDGEDLFDDIALLKANDPETAAHWLRAFLHDPEAAAGHGELGRQRAVDLFGIETIAPQWREYLG